MTKQSHCEQKQTEQNYQVLLVRVSVDVTKHNIIAKRQSKLMYKFLSLMHILQQT